MVLYEVFEETVLLHSAKIIKKLIKRIPLNIILTRILLANRAHQKEIRHKITEQFLPLSSKARKRKR